MNVIRKSRSHVAAALLCAATFGIGTALAAVDVAPPGDGPGPTSRPSEAREHAQPQNISGEVQGYNLEPHGNYNGIVLKDGDRILQLNFGPDAGAAISAAAPVGQKVQATAIPEATAGDRAIYRLVSLTGTSGQPITLGGPGSGQTMHAEGTVKQLNYTPRGEVDGAILDTGDFVHVDPHSAAMLKLAVGEKVSAEGRGHAMLMGHNVIEAEKVNDQTIERPPHGQRGPGGPDHHDGPKAHEDGPDGRDGHDGHDGPDGPPGLEMK